MGDPRKPEAVQHYTTNAAALRTEKEGGKKAADNEDPPDMDFGAVMTMLALLMAFLAMVMRYKWAAWGAVLCCLGGVANAEKSTETLMQHLSSVMLALGALFTTYMVR